jgi:Uma2 family endonuclease
MLAIPSALLYQYYDLDAARPVYQSPRQYRESDIIASRAFPELQLTAEQILRFRD